MTTATVAERTDKKAPVSQNTDQPSTQHAVPTRKRRVVVPSYEIFSREGGYEVIAQLPGVAPAGLNVELENRLLTIKGSVAMPDLEGLKTLHAEFSLPDYQASFRIPADVDEEKVKADLENGILTLDLPLRERERKTIEVKVS